MMTLLHEDVDDGSFLLINFYLLSVTRFSLIDNGFHFHHAQLICRSDNSSR